MDQTPPDAGPMTDLGPAAAPEPTGPIARAAYALGGIGLLTATASDSIAVLGRHTGFHLLGSIEMVQAAVVVLAGSAMLVATQVGEHAAVHMVTGRLSRPAAAKLAHIASLVSAMAFLFIAAGSIWVASELWNGFERTELLQLPLRWLRLLWVIYSLLIGFTFLRRALRPAS